LENSLLSETLGQTSDPTAILDTEITFAHLGLGAKLEAAIAASGYTIPTPIQASAIPVALTGKDVLGIAQTGTGKTASFVLPMIARLETGRARARMPRSLILAPTRELAAQVAQNFEKYGVNHKLELALLIGGMSMDDQVKKLDRGVDVLIATPGRLLDHFGRGRVMLMGVEILVIDEADRMLDMGFIPDIEKICKLLPPRRQTLFFSATMAPEITRLVDTFLKDPIRIEATRPATTATTITQSFHFCADSTDWAKRDMLRSLLRADDCRNAIIFCNRKSDVAILLKSLMKHGFNAGALHGDMDQKSRMETLDGFRSGAIKFLAASDVAARGLDIPDVSHVFNFDLPRDSDDYVHRIGRTGRAGKEGTAISIVTADELKQLKDIEKMLGHPAKWAGDGPTEQDLEDSGRRRGGRGRPAPRGRSGAPSSGRPEQQARAEQSPRPQRSDRPTRADRPNRGERTDRPKGGNAMRGELRADPPGGISGDQVLTQGEQPARLVEQQGRQDRSGDHNDRNGEGRRDIRNRGNRPVPQNAPQPPSDRASAPAARVPDQPVQSQPHQPRAQRADRRDARPKSEPVRPDRSPPARDRASQQAEGPNSFAGAGDVPAFLRRPTRTTPAIRAVADKASNDE
jgi:superfamily II DNA/RNA helicase